MSKQRWQEQGGHVSTAMLMLHLEGELGQDEAAVAKHLHECWTCRERLEWLNQGVFTFLDYYRHVLVESVPSAEAQPGMLATLRAEVSRPSPAHVAQAAWRRMTRILPRPSVPFWATTAASLLLAASMSYFWVLAPTRLTASEFLNRVCSESLATAKHRSHAANRRVRIRRGERVFDRELPGPGAEKPPSSGPDPETMAALKIARVDWDDPLNPRNFADWHRTAGNARDVVLESSSSVTLETTLAAGGPVKFVSFTVNREDWRPTNHHIEFHGAPNIDVSELPAAPLESAGPREVLAVRGSPRMAAPAVVPEEPGGPTPTELDDAEVRLREVLHGMQADFYAAPVIRRDQRQISLLAFASSAGQRDEILRAVRDIPYVARNIISPEMARPAGDNSEAGQGNSNPPHRAAPAARAPLADSLRRYCGGLEEANSYLAVLAESHSDTLMAASALRSLGERYSAADWNRLSPDLQVRLGRLIDDYGARLRRSARSYDALASPVLDAMLRETDVREGLESRPAAACCLSWREESAGVAEQVQRMQSILTRLFATAETERGDGPPVNALLTACDQARGELKRLLHASSAAKSAPGQVR